MVRHAKCFEESSVASRGAPNGPGRYSLIGLSEDILEVRALAVAGGAGPLGPNFERLYWDEGEQRWTREKPNVESGKPTSE